MSRECTCAGTAPGYPQHESYCGQTESDVDLSMWAAYDSGYVTELADTCTCAIGGSVDFYQSKHGQYRYISGHEPYCGEDPVARAATFEDAKFFASAHNDLVAEIRKLTS